MTTAQIDPKRLITMQKLLALAEDKRGNVHLADNAKRKLESFLKADGLTIDQIRPRGQREHVWTPPSSSYKQEWSWTSPTSGTTYNYKTKQKRHTSPYEKVRIDELLREGMSIGMVAKLLGVRYQTVRARAIKLGYK